MITVALLILQDNSTNTLRLASDLGSMFMKYIEDTHTMYFEVDKISSDGRREQYFSPFEITTSYYNHLDIPIVVTQRNGLSVRINPSGRRDGVLKVQNTYRAMKDVVFDPYNTLHIAKVYDTESEVIKEAIKNTEENAVLKDRNFTISFKVSKDEIEDNGGSIYLAQLDITVSLAHPNYNHTHPYSPSSARQRVIESEANVNNKERFGYSVYIISNNGKFPSKFVNVGGKIYSVPSTANHSLRDGVYVCSSGSITADSMKPVPKVEYYTFEQAASELKLYDTADEAARLGDIDIIAEREVELKKLQIAFKELEHKYKMEKLQAEKDMESVKNLYEMEEHKRKMREMRDKEYYDSRNQERKDYYEDRGHKRKDYSEALKLIPAVVSIALSIAAIVMKSKK